MNNNRSRVIDWLLRNGITQTELDAVLSAPNPARDQIVMILLPALAAKNREDIIDTVVDNLYDSLKKTTRDGLPGIQGKVIDVLRSDGIPRSEAMDFVYERENMRRTLAAGILAGLISTIDASAVHLNPQWLTTNACIQADAILDRRARARAKAEQNQSQAQASTTRSGPR